MIVLSSYKKCLVFSYYILLLWVLKYYMLTCQAINFKKTWSSKERRNNIIYLFNNYKRKSFIYDYSNINGKARTLFLFVHPRNYLINKKNEIETHHVPLVTSRGTYINYYSSTKKSMFFLLFVFFLKRKYDRKEKKLYHKRLGIRKIRLNEKKKDNIYDHNHQSQHSLTNNNMPEYLEKEESEENTAKHKKEEEINQGNRQFLTETKYYKRSKYSKAGYIKEKDHNNNVIEKHEEEKKKKKGLDIFDDFINDRYNIYYTENKEDLVEKMNEKKKKENKMSLPDFFILNYYLDKNRKNNLDLMINEGDNHLIKGGSALTGSFSSTMKNMLQIMYYKGKALL
ncbi:hypothetical protein PFLG_01832 [Plasmodium falciparum RAJ116]|uniref:Uncharacterized protein n=1 Tax=Plasmodium falciparum RAJ116 TaxID=580058 RepID=A0A0L0CXT4_PLAFA|nr:hypothetical protein PFLG_01832 [Plasmodium falciparum RAJ116]